MRLFAYRQPPSRCRAYTLIELLVSVCLIQVWMESVDPDAGFVNGNTFYIYEGASATGRLLGKFVSSQ